MCEMVWHVFYSSSSSFSGGFSVEKNRKRNQFGRVNRAFRIPFQAALVSLKALSRLNIINRKYKLCPIDHILGSFDVSQVSFVSMRNL